MSSSGFFSLCSIFRSLIVMCLGINFFRFILFRVYSVFWIYRFIFLAKFEKSSAIIASITFSIWCSLSFPSRIRMTQMLDIYYSPIGSWGSKGVFFGFVFSACSLSLSCLNWLISVALSSSSVIFPPLSRPFFYWAHPLRYLFQLLHFSVLKFPFGSSLHIHFFAEAFYFHICFKLMGNCSLKHFYRCCFQLFVM